MDEVTREKMLELRKTLLQPSSSSACLEGKGFHGNKSCQDDTSCKKKVVRSQSVVFPVTSAVPARRVHSLEEENPDDIKQTEKRRETEWEREKRALDQLERSILEEELAAQTSRERMAQLNSQLQVRTSRECCIVPMSSHGHKSVTYCHMVVTCLSHDCCILCRVPSTVRCRISFL